MNVIIVLLFAVLVVASPVEKPQNGVDILVRKGLEYVRWLLQRHEPIPFPPLPNQHITYGEIDLQYRTGNVTGSELRTFIIDNVTSNLVQMSGSFGITVPKAHVEGAYEVTGTAFKKNVQGSGTFTIDVDTFTLSGKIELGFAEHYLHINDLDLDYQITGIKFDLEDLNIEGVTKEEIDYFLNQNFLNYLEENKDSMRQTVASQVKQYINLVLYGHSPSKVLKWLKNTILSTPDPPPYPQSLEMAQEYYPLHS